MEQRKVGGTAPLLKGRIGFQSSISNKIYMQTIGQWENWGCSEIRLGVTDQVK